MKMVVLQLTNIALKLTPVDKAAGKCTYSAPTTFPLPSKLQKGEALNMIPDLAAFTRDCMCSAGYMQRKTTKQLPKVIFCCEDDRLITKEYQHLPVKAANLQAFANLEAEAVLQSSIKDYIIENYEYHKIDERTNKLKSVLYAVPAKIIRDIKLEFKRSSINVVQVTPPISGLINATKMALNLGPFNRYYKNRTFAVIDVGFEKIHLALFNNNVPIFSKTFESIYMEILAIVSKERKIPLADAEKIISHQGISNSFTTSITAEESKRQINQLLEATFSEIIRNIRVVVSSERLELENVIFCGAFASQPNFNSFVTDLALGAPFENIEIVANQSNHHIALDQRAFQAGCHPCDFFCINGLVLAKKEESVDFLRPLEKSDNDRTANFGIMAVITALVLVVMAMPVVMLFSAQSQVSADVVALANPNYKEPVNLLKEQDQITAQIKAIDSNKKLLPYQKSKMEEAMTQVFTKLAPQVLNIASCNIDLNGTVTLTFSTKTVNDAVAFRKSIMNDGYFTVSVPFQESVDEATKICTCFATLSITGFTPYPANGGTSK